MNPKFLLIFGSLSEPYTFFGPYDSEPEAYDAARSTHVVGAGYSAYTVMPVLPPSAIVEAAGDIPKVDMAAIKEQQKAAWNEWSKKLSPVQSGQFQASL